MDKFTGFLVALVVGMMGVSVFCVLMAAFCGPNNQLCGGAVQPWQWVCIASILLVPQALTWYMTKDK
jgi:hypothetical protein